MNLIRGLLLDNLGLKLLALIMAVLVYLNVYTDRPASMLISFPIQIADLSDSLSLVGPLPGTVQAELKGTGKQLIRIRLSEPMLKISLAGVERGRYERSLSASDLPLADFPGVEVDRVVGPRMLELSLDGKLSRRVRVVPRLEGPAAATLPAEAVRIDPEDVLVTGPESVVATLVSLELDPVRVEGRRDTVRIQASLAPLPEWCTAEPPTVTVSVALRPAR